MSARSAHDSPGTSTRQRLLGVAPIAVGALPLLILTVVTLVQAHQPSSVGGDLAALELRTRAAVHFRELLGPYSRYGWDHPGPIAFYWAAPFYLVSGERPGGLAAASAAANLGWVIAIIAAARNAAGQVVAWCGTAVVLGLVAVLGVPWLRFAWNPFQVILPVAAVGVLGAATGAGVRWALPVAAIAATWAVQTHLGTTPVVVALVLVTVVPAMWAHRRSWRTWRSPFALALGGTLLLWVPPLFDQIHRPPGNLRLILRFFQASIGTTHRLGEVLRLVAPQLTLSSQRLGSRLATSTGHFRPVGPGEAALLIVLLAILAFGAWRGGRAGARFQLGCCLAGLGGSLASVLATRAAAGDLLPYFTSFATGVGVLVWFGVLLTGADLASAAWRSSARHRSVLGAAPSSLAGMGAAAVLILALILSVDAIRSRSFSSISDHPDIGHLVAASRRALGPRVPGPVLVVVGRNHPWPQAVGLAAGLERQGITVHTSQPWVFLFGYDYRPHLDEVDGLLVLGARNGRFPTPPRGAVFVAQADIAQVWRLPAAAAARATSDP